MNCMQPNRQQPKVMRTESPTPPNILITIVSFCSHILFRIFNILTDSLDFICHQLLISGEYTNIISIKMVKLKLNKIPNIFYIISIHRISRNPIDGVDSQKREFYDVYVHDRNLINYIKENLKRRDRVFVNGFLNHKPETDQDGKKAFSGFIEATNILKIDRFSDIAYENPIDESIKSVNE